MTSKPIALLFADAHLDTNAWANRPRVYGDSMAAFDHIVDAACELEVDTIVGAGDLIDVKKPQPVVANFIRQRLDRARDCGITFAFIQGQHELSRDVPWFSAMHDGTEHIDQALLYLSNGMPLYALDWRPASQVAAAIDGISAEAEIIVMHQVWKQFMGATCAAEASFTQLPAGKVLFTGDYHFNKDEDYLVSGGQLHVISPGSTNLRSISEPSAKHYYLLYDDGEFARCEIPSRVKLEVRIKNVAECVDFCANWRTLYQDAMDVSVDMPEHLRYPLLWLKYPAELPEVFIDIEKVVDGRAEIFRKEVLSEQEGPVVERFAREGAVAGGLLSCLELLVDKERPDYAILQELLTSDDQQAALDRIRAARGISDEA